jgi:dienelactone hydrolase
MPTFMLFLITQFAPGQSVPTGVRERELRVGQGEWAVDATLTLPPGKGHFPAVLLVPGSGMTDRDVTIGRNKIFRDLAGGLASRGIVVLRAEKRLSQHADKFRAQHIPPSLRTEFIDDAITATHMLQSMPEVDPKRVYVLGHSQGATFAPQIANEAGGVAGVIILAGSTRKPGEMIEAQVKHAMSQPNASGAERKEADEALALARQLKHLPADDNTFVAGMPAGYWRYFYTYNAGAEAMKFMGRLLVIQNGRDYEVTKEDFDGWKQALGQRRNVTMKVYPKLNHVLQEGVGPSFPDEYEKLGGVSPELIADLAAWLLQ